jgi:hypothetical protein
MKSAMTGDITVMPADMPGCDSMNPTSGDHGKSKASLCKMTTQCQMGSLCRPVSSPSIVQPAGSFAPASFRYAQSLSLREPDGLWRPTQSL